MDASKANGGHALNAILSIPVVMKGDVELPGIGHIIIVAANKVDRVVVAVDGVVIKFTPGNGYKVGFPGDVHRAIEDVKKRAVINPDVPRSIFNHDAIVFAKLIGVRDVKVPDNDVGGGNRDFVVVISAVNSKATNERGVGAEADDSLVRTKVNVSVRQEEDRSLNVNSHWLITRRRSHKPACVGYNNSLPAVAARKLDSNSCEAIRFLLAITATGHRQQVKALVIRR
jgi:hypothetical protein